MTIQKIVFCATMIVAILLSLSALTFGLVTIRPVAAANINGSTPSSLSLSPTQSKSAITDPQSQTPTIPLVPFQLTIANQTVAEPASLSVLAMVGASETGGALSANTASGNAAPPADAVTTNVPQLTANNGSLALIPVSAGAGGSGLILVSYGAAIVVLGVMRYWSFSFDEDAESSLEGVESSPELNSENVVYMQDSAYSTIDIVEYGTAEGQ
jgi:hypothetical protein